MGKGKKKVGGSANAAEEKGIVTRRQGGVSRPVAAERDKKLSKLMSLMLRHEPEEFGLRLDPEDGSCGLDELLAAVRRRTGYEETTEEDVRGVVRRSDKQRFEIVETQTVGGSERAAAEVGGMGEEGAEPQGGRSVFENVPRIRARYGHSFGRLTYPQGTPPDVLYHGTNQHALSSIMEHGLLPMGREYVHLSGETHFAALAGRRRGQLVMLTVDTKTASEGGIIFYDAGSGVWLAERIPASVLAVDETYSD
ncbi:RNA 2'-phosphotransferase [Saccharibacillus kuerlensis]|uniref:Probable RNA 2'-phosphotransferase n=1 Tax=Saccharibacillus kuerlensis TaxID=459527 RepID=A0ABQ2L016_9BACL|nr:RNA 2'-phosphotransferase [Saccharibacillus kuerlensis]GGN98348.1 putative RNA 2'-phosphotransferase [Saccharibacillus kuerlensis]